MLSSSVTSAVLRRAAVVPAPGGGSIRVPVPVIVVPPEWIVYVSLNDVIGPTLRKLLFAQPGSVCGPIVKLPEPVSVPG